MEYPHFKVCVRCFTFNHSKYITDAMNGFVMQQTNFPYVCCIVDDASTDGEQEVIRKYVSDYFDLSDDSCHFERETNYAFITYAQHRTNKNCYFAVLYLKENHKSIKKSKMPYMAEWQDECEYQALCEGDDYWIDVNKLQRQVYYMDSHQDCTLTCHNAFVYSLTDTDVSAYLFNNLSYECDINLEQVLWAWLVPTASFIIRKSTLRYPDWAPSIYSGDLKRLLYSLMIGTVHFFPNNSSVYRMVVKTEGKSSSSRFKDKGLFILKEHKRLIEGLDKGSNGQYHDVFQPRIDFLNDEIVYHSILDEKKYYKLLLIPKILLRKALRLLNNR